MARLLSDDRQDTAPFDCRDCVARTTELSHERQSRARTEPGSPPAPRDSERRQRDLHHLRGLDLRCAECVGVAAPALYRRPVLFQVNCTYPHLDVLWPQVLGLPSLRVAIKHGYFPRGDATPQHELVHVLIGPV